jgi:hypothetical protein
MGAKASVSHRKSISQGKAGFTPAFLLRWQQDKNPIIDSA